MTRLTLANVQITRNKFSKARRRYKLYDTPDWQTEHGE